MDGRLDPAGRPLAGFGRRLLAQLADAVWMLPFALFLLLLGSLVRGGAGLSPGSHDLVKLILLLTVLLFWAGRGATPGKWIMGLRIVDAATGGAPSMGQLVLRCLGYVVSALAMGLGYLWVLWDPRRQGWHDKLGRTLVVRVQPPV
ncbi:RDD family protein [Roseomonas sp. OT10]|uniref:RDD family protein n=1 Tax=Roseomonas cutis TaxID=2897332 RepID=UPI001E329F84|nr:RDD family protein [Roseomonas sp. OT10]UFN47294.1 RDD family protein [Roseomonas sp. OT10]